MPSLRVPLDLEAQRLAGQGGVRAARDGAPAAPDPALRQHPIGGRAPPRACSRSSPGRPGSHRPRGSSASRSTSASAEALKMARYCSSLSRSARSARLCLRDVAADVQHVRLAAVLDRHAAQFELVAVAVAAQQLASPARPARRRAPARAARGSSRRHRRRIGQHAVHAEHLVAAYSRSSLVGGVDVDDAEIGVAQHQRVGRGVEDAAVLRLAVAQRLVARAGAR